MSGPLHFAELHPGMRVHLPTRPDAPHVGPCLILMVREYWDGTWEMTFGIAGITVTRRFSAADAERGALPAEEVAA